MVKDFNEFFKDSQAKLAICNPVNVLYPAHRQDSAAPARKVELEGGLVEEQLRKSWGRIELLKQQQQQQTQPSEEEDDDDDDEETEQTGKRVLSRPLS